MSTNISHAFFLWSPFSWRLFLLKRVFLSLITLDRFLIFVSSFLQEQLWGFLKKPVTSRGQKNTKKNVEEKISMKVYFGKKIHYKISVDFFFLLSTLICVGLTKKNWQNKYIYTYILCSYLPTHWISVQCFPFHSKPSGEQLFTVYISRCKLELEVCKISKSFHG